MSTDNSATDALVETLGGLLIGERPLTPPEAEWIPLHEFSCFHHSGLLPVRPQYFDADQPWPPYYLNHNCIYCDLAAYIDELARIYVRHLEFADCTVKKCGKMKENDPLRRSVLIRNALTWEFYEIRRKCAEMVEEREWVLIERWGHGKDRGITQAFLNEICELGS